MPRLLYTYLTNQILAPFYANLIILTSVLFLGKLIPILDVILDYNIGLADFFRLYAYFTPQLLLFTLPMAGMMGVIIGTAGLNNANELMALKASGISLYRMLPAVITVALVTAVLTGIFSIYLIPAGNRAKVELAFQLAKEKVESSIHAKRFNEKLGDIVMYADRIDPETRKWTGIYISDLRDSEHPVTILSQSGLITADSARGTLSISLHDGVLNRATASEDQTIRFSRYDLLLPLESPGANPLAKKGRSTMRQSELLAETERLGPESRAAAAYLNEFHQRLALPVSCFILTLLGFPLGFLSGPRHKSIGISLGLAVFIFYYVLLTGAKTLSESLYLPAVAAMWLPNILFLGLTILFIRSVGEEKFTRYLERFYDLNHALFHRFHKGQRGS